MKRPDNPLPIESEFCGMTPHDAFDAGVAARDKQIANDPKLRVKIAGLVFQYGASKILRPQETTAGDTAGAIIALITGEEVNDLRRKSRRTLTNVKGRGLPHLLDRSHHQNLRANATNPISKI